MTPRRLRAWATVAIVVGFALYVNAACYGPPVAPKRVCTRTIDARAPLVSAAGDTAWFVTSTTIEIDCADSLGIRRKP